MKVVALFNQVRSKIFGPRLHNVQYKTNKNTVSEAPEYSFEEGGIEADFTPKDEHGIIVKNEGASEADPVVEESKPEEVSSPQPEETRNFTFFNCSDLNSTFQVTGIRDGTVHVISEDELGAAHNERIEGVFSEKGSPKVKGIIIRKPTRDTKQNISYEPLGYIDLTEYIGINSSATLALEDIIRDNVNDIKSGKNKIPQEVLQEIATDQYQT